MTPSEAQMARHQALARELQYWLKMMPPSDLTRIVEQAEEAIVQALEKMRSTPRLSRMPEGLPAAGALVPADGLVPAVAELRGDAGPAA